MDTKTKSLYIIDDFHPDFVTKLENAGIACNYQAEFQIKEAGSDFYQAEMVAVRSKLNFTAELMQRMPQLRCIARGGAGMDNIDEDYAKAHNITLLNAPEGNRDAVAEHAVGLLLGLSNGLYRAFDEVKNMQWNREANRGWEIGGKTVGIVGFGNTGTAFAQKLSGFGCKVLAYDKYKKVDSDYARETDLETLLNQADILSFHVPLTKETKGFVNLKMIEQMKDEVVLLNTARGGILKLEDVHIGIIGGKIKSFGSDVLENENLPTWTPEEKQIFENLIASNQVLITPHVAGWTVESYQKIADVLSDKIIEYTMKAKNN